MFLHVEHPTNPYRILCSRCERHWWFWSGAGGLTNRYQVTVLAVCHYNIALPIITGRGVKYTHNDRDNDIPHPDSGPTRIRLIPTEHTQKKVAVRDGGAQHRSVDTPTPPHNVPTRHAVAKVHTVAGPKAWTPRPPQSRRTIYIL